MENPNNPLLPRIGGDKAVVRGRLPRKAIRFPEDYAGRWIILFQPPVGLHARLYLRIHDLRGTQRRIERSTASLWTLGRRTVLLHIAWLRTIRDKIVYRGMQHVEGALPADRRSADESRQPLRHDPAGRKFDVGRPERPFIDPDATIRAVISIAGAGPQSRRDQTRARRPANRRPLQRGATRRLASGDEAIVPTARRRPLPKSGA